MSSLTRRYATHAIRLIACCLFGMHIGAAPAQEGTSGRSLYAAYGCYQCHGYEGQGGVAGLRIAPSPYPYLAFAQLVRRPSNVMPAYSAAVLDDATLRAIYDFVRTVPEPPAAADIPALRQ